MSRDIVQWLHDDSGLSRDRTKPRFPNPALRLQDQIARIACGCQTTALPSTLSPALSLIPRVRLCASITGLERCRIYSSEEATVRIGSGPSKQQIFRRLILFQLLSHEAVDDVDAAGTSVQICQVQVLVVALYLSN